MRILFWNVQRLGATTDDARRTILGNMIYATAPDLTLLCELTTASTVPQAQNITYRHTNPWQLCYGAFDRNGTTVPLTRVNPPAGAGYNGLFLGGNNFANLVDRALAFAGVVNNFHVYVFHAPAYQFGANRAMTFLAYALDAHHRPNNEEWLVIGDFNIEPVNLTAFAQNFVVAPPTATYIGSVPTRSYDYVMTSNVAAMTLQVFNPGGPGSDHLPIVLDY